LGRARRTSAGSPRRCHGTCRRRRGRPSASGPRSPPRRRTGRPGRWRQLLGAHRHRSSSLMVHRSSPRTRSTPYPGTSPVLHEEGRPRAEVLDAADLDVGRVDVDPVSGNPRSAGTTSARSGSRGSGGRRRPGAPPRHRRVDRPGQRGEGIDEITCSAGTRSWCRLLDGHGHGTPPPGARSWPSPPCARRHRAHDLLGAPFHIIPDRTSGTGTPRSGSSPAWTCRAAGRRRADRLPDAFHNDMP